MSKLLKNLPAILTVSEVSKALYVSEKTVYRLLKEGELTGFKAEGKTWNFLKEDVLAFIEKRTTLVR